MAKAKAINENKILRGELGNWLEGYDGRIVSLETPDEAYHLVFSGDGVAVREGDYPSCEGRYRGSEENIIAVIEGADSAYRGYPEGHFHFWGSLSEMVKFEKLIAAAK